MNGKLQDFNQLLSEAGLPAFVPDADTELAAEAIAGCCAETDERLSDPTHLERAFGAQTWQWFLENLDTLGDTPRDTSFLTAFGQPESAARFDVVCQVVPLEIVSVAKLSDYQRVAEHRMRCPGSTLRGCGARLSRQCNPSDHSKLWAHKRGAVVLVVAMCPACRNLLRSGGPTEDIARDIGTGDWLEEDWDTAISRPDPLAPPKPDSAEEPY